MSETINDRLTIESKHTLKLLEEMCESIKNTSLCCDERLVGTEHAAWWMDKVLSLLSNPFTAVMVESLIKELRSIAAATKQDQGEQQWRTPLSPIEKEFFADVFPLLALDGWFKDEQAGLGMIKYRYRLPSIESIHHDGSEYWARLELGVKTTPTNFKVIWIASVCGGCYRGKQLAGPMVSLSCLGKQSEPVLLSDLTAKALEESRSAIVDYLDSELEKFIEEEKEDLARKEIHLAKLRSIVRGQFSGDGLESGDE